jgi:sarcosine/dimethylglycine N-methyltransferase
MSEKNLVQITQEYYDSEEADNFYFHIWGGEDIHIGIYAPFETPVKTASRNTVAAMVEVLPGINKDTKILDIGSGYGGAARYLASEYGCKVDCLNLSATENKRNDERNREVGLDHLISVTTGNFEDLPFDAESYDIVWSQDAILHSDKKERVFQEVNRVLKPGGVFILTDPMQSDDCPEGVLDPVLERIHLKEMGSVKRYREIASKLGMEEVVAKEMPEQLVNHYSRVLQEVERNYDEIIKKSSEAYIQRMMNGLKHWIEGGKQGYLNWGILVFKK